MLPVRRATGADRHEWRRTLGENCGIGIGVWVLAILIIVGSGACSRTQWGFPRTAVASTSPDGRYHAFVKNHATIDPPAQSLWLTSADGPAREVRRLSEDQDWCNVIAWSGDSQSVAFLVQDARLIIVDAGTRHARVDRWLVDRDGSDHAYGHESRMVRRRIIDAIRGV